MNTDDAIAIMAQDDWLNSGAMTADDFDARATYLEHMANGIKVSAQWCRNVAAQMRAEGVKTAKKLSALPPLPNLE